MVPDKSKNTKKVAKNSNKNQIKLDRSASKSSINDMEDEIEDAKASILYDTNAEICKAGPNTNVKTSSHSEMLWQRKKSAVKKSCWQRVEDYLWLENHNFFYICAVHEYCMGRNNVNPQSTTLIAVRSMLFLVMLCLIVIEVPVEKELRWQYMTNWGVYITFASTILNLLCTFKYRKCFKNFKLQLKSTSIRLNANVAPLPSGTGTHMSLFESDMKSNISNNAPV